MAVAGMTARPVNAETIPATNATPPEGPSLGCEMRTSLTAGETEELQELQLRADKRLESFDSEMLDDVAAMETAVGAHDASTS
jgi:hypothetical protein